MARRHGIVAALLLAACIAPAHAQVQRNFLNPSFEVPALVAANPATGCYRQLDEALVPGWTSTHPVQAGSGDCTSPGASTGRLIELWRTNFQGVQARVGNNFAEVNAEASSRLYQNACLINGERIDWRFSHRGRGSATVKDVLQFIVGASSPVVTVGSTSNGSFDTPVVQQGTAATPQSGGNGWVDYNGNFAYSGVTGTSSLGFESISTGSGSNTVGNFLDAIQIVLRPFVEFTQSSSSTPEGSSNNLPTLRVNGTVATTLTVTVLVTGGTATLGTDFTTPGNSPTMTVTVPAGVYDGVSAASLFALPITIVQDAVVESNETIELAVQPAPGVPAQFLLNSSATCGAPAQTTWIYTIVDDDSTINVVKNVQALTAVPGQPTQLDVLYSIVVRNPTTLAAAYGLVDTAGFDPDVSVVSANYTRNGGAATALAGAGPWTLQPAYGAIAGNGTDTWLLTVRISVNRGGSPANDTCAVPSVAGSGLHNRATATLQGANGAPDSTFESSACRNTPTPVWVTLRKQLTARAVASDQVQVRLLAAGNPAATAMTTGTTAPASASTGVVVLTAGGTVQFDETVRAAGNGPEQPPANYAASLSCANATAGSSTALPGGAGTNAGAFRQWPEFTPVAGDDIDCVVVNTPTAADLQVTKTNTPASGPDDLPSDTVVSGSTSTYSIVVRNNGPVAADNATLRDPPPTNLVDCALGAPACAATGGAQCPQVGAGAGQLSVANLQSASGVQLPVLPVNGAVTVLLSCKVP